jgi:pterin-4a-carbinolamine dehydratase
MRYRELVETVAQRADVSTEEARDAADATIDTLARTLSEPQRQRLLERIPAKLRQQSEAPGPAPDPDSFVAAVSWLTGVEQTLARYRAQTVLSTVAQWEPDLMGAIHVPNTLRELFDEPPSGGGVTNAYGHAAPLTPDELAEALRRLPYWSGDRVGLRRTLVLPRENLDAVLTEIALLKPDYGRAPHIERTASGSAVLIASTHSVGAVTALDVELAHRVDAVIEAVGAGID